MEEVGGPPTPAVGFATGIERIIVNLKEQEVPVPGLPPLEVYVAYPAPEAREVALGLVRDLRQAGVGAVMAMGGRSLKSQMRQADALDARYVAILGAEELVTGTVLLRRMADGGQQRVLLG